MLKNEEIPKQKIDTIFTPSLPKNLPNKLENKKLIKGISNIIKYKIFIFILLNYYSY